MKYFRLIWRNVFRKKLRTTLTASSIILVLTLIVILASLLQAMQADPSGGRGANRLVVRVSRTHSAGKIRRPCGRDAAGSTVVVQGERRELASSGGPGLQRGAPPASSRHPRLIK